MGQDNPKFLPFDLIHSSFVLVPTINHPTCPHPPAHPSPSIPVIFCVVGF